MNISQYKPQCSQIVDRLPDLLWMTRMRQETLPETMIARTESVALRGIIKFQALWRGYVERAAMERRAPNRDTLCPVLVARAKPYMDDLGYLLKAPRASAGFTRCYLPIGLPLIIKQSGYTKNVLRFTAMSQARDICDANGFRHLIIPRASCYKNFIIEKRLPIAKHDRKAQMGLYFENRDRFTSAVVEYFKFLCQCTMNDITSNGKVKYAPCKAPLPRYDNVTLYLVNGRGLLGLVDLEKFSPNYNTSEFDWMVQRCQTAIYLFPYHFEEILVAAIEIDPDIKKFRKFLEKHRDHTIDYFNVAYLSHRRFVREKNISFEKPIELLAIVPEQMIQIKKSFVGYIENQGVFREDPGVLINLKINFKYVLSTVFSFFAAILHAKAERLEEPVTSYPQLLAVRSLSIQDACFQTLTYSISNILKTKNSSYAISITESLLEKLVEYRVIAHYYSDGKSKEKVYYIFC